MENVIKILNQAEIYKNGRNKTEEETRKKSIERCDVDLISSMYHKRGAAI